jgi:hypothetical protein
VKNQTEQEQGETRRKMHAKMHVVWGEWFGSLMVFNNGQQERATRTGNTNG